MKNCFLRLFYDEIAKCSVHSNIFVKPKQYVSCLLVLWCFSPWFCKFSRLVCSVKCLYVESIFYHFSNVFMGFSLDYLQFPSVNFLKTLCSCSNRAKHTYIQANMSKFKKNLQISFLGIVIPEYLKNLFINLPSNFDMFFFINHKSPKKVQKVSPKGKKLLFIHCEIQH